MHPYMTSQLARLHREALIEEARRGRLAAAAARYGAEGHRWARSAGQAHGLVASGLRFFGLTHRANLRVESAADCR